jgi:adenylate cyclase
LTRKGKIDVDAYNLFLRGRERMWLHTRTGNVEARTMQARAIAINPVFAAAHACIAVTHVNDYINGWAEIPERSLQSGLEIAARAILMDDEDPHAHGWFAVALLWHREHDRALAEVQRCQVWPKHI